MSIDEREHMMGAQTAMANTLERGVTSRRTPWRSLAVVTAAALTAAGVAVKPAALLHVRAGERSATAA